MMLRTMHSCTRCSGVRGPRLSALRTSYRGTAPLPLVVPAKQRQASGSLVFAGQGWDGQTAKTATTTQDLLVKVIKMIDYSKREANEAKRQGHNDMYLKLQRLLACLEEQKLILMQEEAKLHGRLLTYLEGLVEEDKVDVFARLAANGYTIPGLEDEVFSLTDDTLKEIGIERAAVRSKVLRAIALSGPSKTVFLLDRDTGYTRKTFNSKRSFENWVAVHPIQTTEGAEVISTWEELEDGSDYEAADTLHNWVVDSEDFPHLQSDKALTDEVAEMALQAMRVEHKDAYRKFRGHGQKLRLRRTTWKVDEIIVADTCCSTLVVKATIDKRAAEQLEELIQFIKDGFDSEDQGFNFARRSDGSMKELRGALGGLRLEQQPDSLNEEIEKKGWGLFLVDDEQAGCGSRCHEVPPAGQREAASSVDSAAAAAAQPPTESV